MQLSGIAKFLICVLIALLLALIMVLIFLPDLDDGELKNARFVADFLKQGDDAMDEIIGYLGLPTADLLGTAGTNAPADKETRHVACNESTGQAIKEG